MGYLTENGNITITVDSDDDDWKNRTQQSIIYEVQIHMGGQYNVRDGSREEKRIRLHCRMETAVTAVMAKAAMATAVTVHLQAIRLVPQRYQAQGQRTVLGKPAAGEQDRG